MISLDELNFDTPQCSYREFLNSKHIRSHRSGFTVSEDRLPSKLFDWQRLIVRWSLAAGRAALFEECGLGKTFQQLAWAEQVIRRENKPVLLLCPIAVGRQTVGEAEKFGISVDVRIAKQQSEVCTGINISNYERIHLFDPKEFVGVVLDESSILKSFNGKTKTQLCDSFRDTPYKLACTATPSPNDRMEIGNHSEFLGVMPSNEMLARWFINSGDKVGLYRLRKHGAKDFWRWVASWAVCIDKPSVLGFSDEGYSLPDLLTHTHLIEDRDQTPIPGHLFNPGKALSATNIHTEKKSSVIARTEMVASLVNRNDHAWAVWCDTDYEADALALRIPDATEVRGSHSAIDKEFRLNKFATGETRVIITKGSLAGFGVNWQHCSHTTLFANWSFEQRYQIIRRFYRFGQKNAVHAHFVMTESENAIANATNLKEEAHQEMKCEMAEAMREGSLEEIVGKRSLSKASQTELKASMPSWIRSKS